MIVTTESNFYDGFLFYCMRLILHITKGTAPKEISLMEASSPFFNMLKPTIRTYQYSEQYNFKSTVLYQVKLVLRLLRPLGHLGAATTLLHSA